MKTLPRQAFALFCVLLLVKPAAGAEETGVAGYEPARLHALIVAINDYKHWPDLRCAVSDGRAIAQVLKKQYSFGDVKLLENEQASREAILETLDSYLSLGRQDSLLVYYAGHGWMDPKVQTGYWVPSDARRDKKVDYVANSRIVEDYFKKYKVKHLLVMADSCFSGTLLRGIQMSRDDDWRLPAGFKKPSRWVMTSGDLSPVADDSGEGHSPFASRVLQYLRYSDSAAFGVQDLYVYVRKNTKGEAIAQPMKTTEHMPGGEFVFCRLAGPSEDTADPKDPDAGNLLHIEPKAAERFYLKSSAGLFRSAQYESIKERFERKGETAVFDNNLKKTWHLVDQTGIYSRKKALEACRSVGPTCRLPTLAELQSLITRRKDTGDWGLIDGSFFPKHSRTTKFWSSTKSSFGGYSYVDFSRGMPDSASEIDHFAVIGISDN